MWKYCAKFKVWTALETDADRFDGLKGYRCPGCRIVIDNIDKNGVRILSRNYLWVLMQESCDVRYKIDDSIPHFRVCSYKHHCCSRLCLIDDSSREDEQCFLKAGFLNPREVFAKYGGEVIPPEWK